MDTCFNSLKGHFLIATPGMQDSMFSGSITYLCEHTREGAMGLMVNHPLDLSLDEIFDHLEIPGNQHTHLDPILAGGPVHMDRGFVLHRSTDKEWEHSLHLTPELSLTTSQDILTAIAQDEGPRENLVALGYAGWGAGQLEDELADNTWLTVPANNDILFKTPYDQRAMAAAALSGIDLARIAPQAGHA